MRYDDLPLFAELEAPEPEPSPVTLVCADVLAWAETYAGPKFHAMLCDPPYHLYTTVERYGKPGSAPNCVTGFFNADGSSKGASPYHTMSQGFMGQSWDGGDIAFKPDTWKALAQHLLPGAFGMCFASSRGWHRLACAIEDAGLRIHPSIFMLGWVNGASFPKASRIDSQIDAIAESEREVIYHDRYRDGRERQSSEPYDTYSGHHSANGNSTTAAATPLAKIWEGHRYGGQVLKNSLEPIIVFQKPYQGKPVQSITQTGAGALWIEGARLQTSEHLQGSTVRNDLRGGQYGNGPRPNPGDIPNYAQHPAGRWPPNFALCHTPHCIRVGARQVQGTNRSNDRSSTAGGLFHRHTTYTPDYADATGLETVAAWDCAPGCPVKALDAQAGERSSHGQYDENIRSRMIPIRATEGPSDKWRSAKAIDNYGDTGGASRFFHVSDYSLDVAERLAQADPVFYAAKASSSERSNGLDGMMKLRGDLTEDELAYVMRELKAAGVEF